MSSLERFRWALLTALAGGVLFALVPAAGATTGTMVVTGSTTLTEDHSGSIVIGADNVTLDCGGHSVTGSDFAGIDLTGHSGVTNNFGRALLP